MTLFRPGDIVDTEDGRVLIALPHHLARTLPDPDAPFRPMAIHTSEALILTDGEEDFDADDLPVFDFAGVVSDRGTWQGKVGRDFLPDITRDLIIRICMAHADAMMTCADACVRPGMADDPQERDAFLRDAARTQALLMTLDA